MREDLDGMSLGNTMKYPRVRLMQRICTAVLQKVVEERQ